MMGRNTLAAKKLGCNAGSRKLFAMPRKVYREEAVGESVPGDVDNGERSVSRKYSMFGYMIHFIVSFPGCE